MTMRIRPQSSRRRFLSLMALSGMISLTKSPKCFALEGTTSEVPWLKEVTEPPSILDGNGSSLRSLLADRGGISKEAFWKQKRQEILRDWIQFLGHDPNAPRPKIAWKKLGEESIDDLLRIKIAYEPHPGWPVEAYILRPREVKSPLPAAVVLHPTVNHSIDEPVGIKSNDGSPQGPRALGLHLARKGFCVIVPRNYLWPTNDKIAAKEQATKWNEEQDRLAIKNQKPKMKGMAKMLYDTQIAIDILESLQEVDRKRISVIGHSLGAKEALYAVAFDHRVRSAAASEGGIGIRFSNWEAEWYLGSSIQHPTFDHEHHELLGLAAPKPLLIVGGESADGDRGWHLLRHGQEIYSLDGICRLGQYNHRTGHPMTEEASQRMVEWLTTYG